MPQVEHYRDDLEFNSNGIDKLQRSTLCLADHFNAIFDQLFSNDKSLKDSITELVTDFGTTVLSVLLGSTLVETITSVTKQSVFYTLLEKALEAAGVEWNFNNSNAWYICFGDLLGGLIIQGGTHAAPGDANAVTVPLPISYSGKSNYIVVASNIHSNGANGEAHVIRETASSIKANVYYVADLTTKIYYIDTFNFLCVGK